MPVCAFKTCSNYNGKSNNSSTFSYHRFPSDPVIVEKWVKIIRQNRRDEFWIPHRTSVVCSEHFKEQDIFKTPKGFNKLKKGAIPSKVFNEQLIASLVSQTGIPEIERIVTEPIIAMELVPKAEPLQDAQENETPEWTLSTFLDEQGSASMASSDDEEPLSAYETPEERKLKLKIKKLKAKLKTKQAQYKAMYKKMRRLQVNNYSLKNNLKKIKRNNFMDSKLLNSFKNNILTVDVFNNIYRKKRNEAIRCTKEIKEFSITLNSYSPSAYKYVRKCFDKSLPHPKSLLKWSGENNCKSGISYEQEFSD